MQSAITRNVDALLALVERSSRNTPINEKLTAQNLDELVLNIVKLASEGKSKEALVWIAEEYIRKHSSSYKLRADHLGHYDAVGALSALVGRLTERAK